MKERYLVMDVAKCHDCNNCFMACTDEHAENDWSPYQRPMPRHGHRWLDLLRHERGQNDRIDTAFLVKPCMQCGEASCSEAGDFVSVREDGIVVFDADKGAGKDVSESCPYGSVWWNEAEQVSQKCDFCAHLLDDPSWEQIGRAHV
jgi:Fe-S-cluster-containing dehydrogenase component